MSSKFGFNPWVLIWTQPRKTIRAIVEKDPKHRFIYLATIYAFQTLLFIANNLKLGQQHNIALIILISFLISPIIGSIFLYFNAWILHFTGKWLKGNAPFLHVRAALSWSKVPLLISLLMWFVLFAFSSEVVLKLNAGGATTVFINLISLITGIWSFVILVQCVQEIQNFSVWRSIGNIIIAFVIGYILVYLISYIINSIYFMF